MQRTAYQTMTRGLDRQSPAMKLFEKAKRLGVWNPSDIDLTQDVIDWQRLLSAEKRLLLHLTALFQAGEEAVTLDLLPLIMTIAKEGRVEEEMYLTTFLWEEAKHVDFFNRVLGTVLAGGQPLDQFIDDNYHFLFFEALPHALAALSEDPSPAAQVRASVTYNMIVEGVLAETGYHAYFTVLERHDLMPGVREGIRLLKQDESRHIAYGVYLISRLVAENPSLWQIVEETMQHLLAPTLGIIDDIFARYEPVPFGLVKEEFHAYAMGQFQKRMARVALARTTTIAQVDQLTHTVIEADDG